MKTCAEYLHAIKVRKGDRRMPDRELGELLGGYSQTAVATAKAGRMSDPMALRVAAELGIEPGEVVMVARCERERDPAVAAALRAYMGKILASAPAKAAALLAAVVLGAVFPTHDARAAVAHVDGSNPTASAIRRWLRALMARPVVA